jgi:uncharacterized protein YhfF
MWREYLQTADRQNHDPVSGSKIPAWHFCDNKADADECARLVMIGKKRATSPSLWELQLNMQEIPKVGDLNVITNWKGIAQCIIQTTSVEIVPFNEVTSVYAGLEGEGDGSLSYWRKVHQAYYERVLEGSDHSFQQDMPVVCEQFEKVFPLL